ncbi:MAG: hypothetical protein D6690_10795 [Nitrospirae bacterium]|nr:MAG: hypothetical protein D6690_10795 [Nitrospirota bacterium]
MRFESVAEIQGLMDNIVRNILEKDCSLACKHVSILYACALALAARSLHKKECIDHCAMYMLAHIQTSRCLVDRRYAILPDGGEL